MDVKAAMTSILSVPLTSMDHRQGQIGARVQLVQFGDFECPYCASFYPHVEKLVEELGERLCFVYRHFPLRNIHLHSTLAALAAEAAGRQNQFWNMHHLLFENFDRLSAHSILEIAEQSGLEMDQFQDDLDDPVLLEKIEQDFASGIRSAVTAVPAIFINSCRYEGARSYSTLKMEVEDLLRRDQPALWT